MELSLKKVHIELSSRCNLQCVHCSLQTQSYEAQRKDLDAIYVKKTIDELSQKYEGLRINLQGIGEASLHTGLAELVEYITLKGFKAETTSNLLAQSKEEYKALFEKGLIRLAVSLDTLDEAMVQKTRKGTNLALLLENLEYLAEHYGEQIKIQTVVSDLTIDEVPSIYKYLRTLGIKNWELINLNNFDGTEGISEENKKVLQNYIELFEGMNILASLNLKVLSCNQPFELIHINSLGYVMPCCVHWDDTVINFGNIKEENINDIFENKGFNSFRRDLLNNNAKVCERCTLYQDIKRLDLER